MSSSQPTIKWLDKKDRERHSVLIMLLIIVAGIGVVDLILKGIIYHFTSISTSVVICDDGNGATLDFMTNHGCESRFAGNGAPCEDVCLVEETGVAQMVDGQPICAGTCLGTCTSETDPADLFYIPDVVTGETCPTIEWSNLMDNYTEWYPTLLVNGTVNPDAYVLQNYCYMDSCIYYAYLPIELWATWYLYTIGDQSTDTVWIEEQQRICLMLVDEEYAQKNCLRVLPYDNFITPEQWPTCTFMYSCANPQTSHYSFIS